MGQKILTGVKAIKHVDGVISTVGRAALGDQLKIIDAIKDAGNVKVSIRPLFYYIHDSFLPSEFGSDVEHTIHAVESAKTAWAKKVEIRRAVEAQGIPFTYVVSNFFADYFLRGLSQPGATSPPRDKVIILGDGNPKAIFTKEGDIGTYTTRAVDDPRTLNKTLHIRPAANTLSFNELLSLREKKIGKTLEKVYVPEEQVLKNIQETEFPGNVRLAINHSVYVKGLD
ncbi:hypothetical protein KSS87_016564 [Heliosperma pusillum]|nr:hypothetical protein KSS87_016564 [Heliosperma pusillum]